MTNLDRNRRLVDFTLGDLLDILDIYQSATSIALAEQAQQQSAPRHIPQYVFGIDGLAKHLGCSATSIWRRKKAGEFDGAMTQVGRLIRTDITLLK